MGWGCSNRGCTRSPCMVNCVREQQLRCPDGCPDGCPEMGNAMQLSRFVKVLAVAGGLAGWGQAQPLDKVILPPGSITPADRAFYGERIWPYVNDGTIHPNPGQWGPVSGGTLGENGSPFHEALLLFESLYVGRLDLDLDSPTYYDIHDLFDDDPAVLAHFQIYTMTGLLGTTDAPRLMREPPKPGPQDPQEPTDIPDDLKIPFFDFPPRIKWEERDIEDGWPWQPGFDCDDWADTLAEHLRRNLLPSYPDTEIWAMWMSWKGSGHVFTVVQFEGQWYVLDASTGEMRGPYQSFLEAKAGGWDILRGPWYLIDSVWLAQTRKKEPGWRPLREPLPWYTDPGIIDDRRNIDPDVDPDDYIPPTE